MYVLVSLLVVANICGGWWQSVQKNKNVQKQETLMEFVLRFVGQCQSSPAVRGSQSVSHRKLWSTDDLFACLFLD
jgi:hypothetical protein